MSIAGDNDEPSVLDTALPAAPKKVRDTLSTICFYHHMAMMAYILLGWLAPWHAALIVYLVFLPSVIAQWRLNRNTCVLNNIEALLRTGKWRNPRNREEGAWLHTLIVDSTGIPITKLQLDCIMYSVMTFLWGLAFWHLRGWSL